MRFFLGVLVLASASMAGADEGVHGHDHNKLKPHSHIAYHNVENACARDVETICVPKEEHPPMFLLSGDPFFDWIFVSSQNVPAPPEVHDLNLFIDQMFNSVLVSSSSRESTTLWFHEVESPQLIVDVAVARLAAEKEPDEIPQLAHQLQKHGASLLQDTESGSEHHQMARRLTEMDTKTINYHVQLPFGQKNCCLRKAFEHQIVSDKCAHSIKMLENTFVLETEFSRRQEAFIGTMLLYITTSLLLMMVMARHVRARRRSRRRLRRKVLMAVYSNPCIQKQVELEIGESIGHGVKGDSCGLLVNCCEKKPIVQNKDLLLPKKVVCEGVPLQIV